MSTPTTLETTLCELAQARVESERLRTAYAEECARVLEPLEALKLAKDEAAKRAKELDEAVRTLAVKAPAEDLPEQVTIKKATVLTYSPELAIAWAKTAMPALVTEVLDAKAFEKVALAGGLPFVTITKEPKATIASDLSALLPPAPTPELPADEVPF